MMTDRYDTSNSQALAKEGEEEEREKEKEEEQKWRDCIFFLVGNIPAKFRSADLRAMFSQFVEKECFVCFHYRHRPEQIPASPAETTSINSESAGITTDVHAGGSAHSHSEAGGVAKTKCCVVAMERNGSGERTFVQMYANKNWSTADGGFLRQKVRITELKVDFTATHRRSPPNQGDNIIHGSFVPRPMHSQLFTIACAVKLGIDLGTRLNPQIMIT